MNRQILVSEVGPRDGLQSIATIMPLAAKKMWIAAEAASGVAEIEVGSFVPAQLLPQLADTAELVEFARGLPNLTVAVLVPNARGAEAAIRAGAHKITIPVSVSETHSLRNVRRTHAQMLDEVRSIARLLAALPAESRPVFEGGLSTAFGCTLQGRISSAQVIALAAALMQAGCDEIGLADTTGYANPRQVKDLVREVQSEVGAKSLTSLHLHNTRGLGLANVLAGIEVGITTFDSSLGGLGGCPFAPGASGNIVTEDLVFMLEAMGLKTGIDLPRLFAVRAILEGALPNEALYGFAPDAGLPLGFQTGAVLTFRNVPQGSRDAAPAARPTLPLEDPALPLPGPALPLDGPALPLPGPALPLAGPTFPLADPAIPRAGPPIPLPGPALPLAGPALPLAGPALPLAGPALPLADPAIPLAGPPIPLPRPALPLAGIRVVEFSHMVMGPVVGAILVELGAEVIKIEPVGGDATRELPGSGAGYFPMYNRGKKSLCLNLKDPRGVELARRLARNSDVLVENFRSGKLDGLGLSYESLALENPRLIHCSLKGFLDGPYAERTALDEVAQMMGGLAYMTGPPGRPLRAGASVIDVTGGMFGVIGILAALEQRHATGRGQKLTSSLFETTVYLVGQHMAQLAVTGHAAKPMPARVSAWAIYDVFELQGGEQVFLGVVSDTQWRTFCAAFGFETLAASECYATNKQRVLAREVLLPLVRERLATYTKTDLMAALERAGLPFAPINRPEDLVDDPHLRASGGLAPTALADGRTAYLPVLPLELGRAREGRARTLPAAGEHTEELLVGLGMNTEELRALAADRII